jgi:hypothetical protein
VGGVTIDRQANGVGTGSSGFNSALLQTVALGVTGSVLPSSITVSMRVSCGGSGHANGFARLWYNGRAIDTGASRDAGSRVEIPGARSFLRAIDGDRVLRPDAGASRQFIDRLLDSSVACPGRPFTSFGTWAVSGGGGGQ